MDATDNNQGTCIQMQEDNIACKSTETDADYNNG